MNAADELPEPDSPLRTTTMKLPSRDQVTAVQVNTLLQAVQTLNHLVVARCGVVTEPDGGQCDGGVCAALDSTIVRALNQLDDIFGDSPRWTLTLQSGLEKQLSDVYAAHLDLMRAQKQAVLDVGLPHRVAGPKLLQLEGGVWAAILGDATRLDNCILGMGASPAAALADFDEVFNGTKNNEQKPDNVDSEGTPSGENPPNNGTDIRTNQPGAGPDGGVRPT